MTDRLAQIQARADAATEGPWKVSTGMADQSIIFMPDGYSFKVNGHPDSKFIAHARTDVPALLAMVRERDAALGRVEALAAAWDARGRADMSFAGDIIDENISIAILTDGAQMVENARHIRAAITATEGAE